MSQLLAGAAQRNLTPPRGVFLVGYGDRNFGARGVHDEVTATALVLSYGATTLAVVAADLLTVNEHTVDRIRAALDPIEVLVCCSHTHSGPISYADERSRSRDQRYVDLLVAQIVDAVRAAAFRLEPAALEWCEGTTDIGINRRERTEDGSVTIGRAPEEPCDHAVGVLSVVPTSAGRTGPIATVVNHACHGTVLGPRNRLVSADWMGATRRTLEQRLGGAVLFLQGAGANINPLTEWTEPDQFGRVAEIGGRVADAAMQALDSGAVDVGDGPGAVARREVWIPLQATADTDEPPDHHVAPLLAMAGLPRAAAPLAAPLLRRRYPWKPTIEARDGRWAVPLRTTVVRVGDVALVTYAAETFTEIGLAAKQASPAAATMVSSVTDGSIGYLATAAAHREGGYEVDVAPWAYRYPGRLDPVGEELALAATSEALAELWAD